MTTEKIVISRRSAVRRQVEAAIELVFMNGDPVAAHVLASSAASLMSDLAKHAGKASFRSKYDSIVRPERKKEWYKAVRRHYNFFKHADFDAEIQQIEFDPSISHYEIFECVSDYEEVYGEISIPMLIARAYFFLENPFVIDQPYRDRIADGLSLFVAAGDDRFSAAHRHLAIYLSGEWDLQCGIER